MPTHYILFEFSIIFVTKNDLPCMLTSLMLFFFNKEKCYNILFDKRCTLQCMFGFRSHHRSNLSCLIFMKSFKRYKIGKRNFNRSKKPAKNSPTTTTVMTPKYQGELSRTHLGLKTNYLVKKTSIQWIYQSYHPLINPLISSFT